MPSTVRIATEDPLWAVEALYPLLEDYGSPVSVELDLDRGGPVVGRLTAIDQGIAILVLPEGSRRLVPLERIRGIAVLIH